MAPVGSRATGQGAALQDPACLRGDRNVCGTRKLRHLLCHAGFDVARLARSAIDEGDGYSGECPNIPHKATIPDKRASCLRDKANRQFRVPVSNMSWVCDFLSRAFGSPVTPPGRDSFMSPSPRLSGLVTFSWPILDPCAYRIALAGRHFGPCGFRPRHPGTGGA